MAADREQAGSAFGDRYRVERELGRGGTAVVYLARDVELDRAVAIKVLHPDLATALGPERFRREIEIERGLDHPHILGIYDSGENAGRLYYVMPYVDGESLRDRLERERQLPVDDALRIACEVAAALQYAHERGVVHRDVKPENILLEAATGRALVVDFGIARAVDANVGQRLTQTGISLGTPFYMSPEQSAAERGLDGRADQYSLGCVLYEMLAGQPPFTGPNAQSVRARHHLDAVPSITVVRPTVADEVEDIVLRSLAKSAADRYATIGQFADALCDCVAKGRATDRRTVATPRATSAYRRATGMPRRTAALLALATIPVVAGGWAAWRFLLASPPAAQEAAGSTESAVAARRIAVLYFADRSTGQRLAYLADGLTEALIDGLEQVPVLSVVSHNGVLPYRGAQVPRDSIGRALGVGLLVDGRVDEDAGEVVVSVDLVDAQSGVSLNPQPFTVRQPADSTFALRDSVIAEVERYLRSQIGEQVRLRAQRDATHNADAWVLVQRVETTRKRAEALWQAGDTSGAAVLLAQGDSLAARAEHLDAGWPGPAIARGRIALRRASMAVEPDRARPWLEAGLQHAERAVALSPRNADALELRGTLTYARLLRGLARDSVDARQIVEAAERDLRAAVALADAQASAWVRLSELSYRKLNTLDANRFALRAYEKDAYLTSAADVLWRLFATSYDLEQAGDAARWCETGHRRFPEDPSFLRCQILLMTMRGATPDVPRAWQLLAELEAVTPQPERPYMGRFDRILLAAALGRAGLADSARAVLLTARADHSIDPRGELAGYEAFVRVMVGDKAEAIALLDGYLASNPEHREGFAKLNAWWWRELQDDPRFGQLLTRAP